MKIGLLSDTHGYIDEQIKGYLHGVDEIWHAGDVGDKKVIRELHEIAPVQVVYGNIDEGPGRLIDWPEYLLLNRMGCKILMIHIAGKPPTYNSRTRDIIKKNSPTMLIAGHSHILKVQYDQKNRVLFMNPGACGHHGFHKIRTLLLFDINGPRPTNLRVVELGQRGKKKD